MSTALEKTEGPSEAPPKSDADVTLSPLQALGLLGVITAMFLGFVALCKAVDIKNFWVGFLFSFYWFGIENSKPDRLIPSMAGALTGLLVSCALPVFVMCLGADHGALAAFALTLFVIYIRLLEKLKIMINQATVLFATVGSIPVIHTEITVTEMFMSLGLGILFFGGVGLIDAVLKRRKAPKKA